MLLSVVHFVVQNHKFENKNNWNDDFVLGQAILNPTFLLRTFGVSCKFTVQHARAFNKSTAKDKVDHDFLKCIKDRKTYSEFAKFQWSKMCFFLRTISIA